MTTDERSVLGDEASNDGIGEVGADRSSARRQASSNRTQAFQSSTAEGFRLRHASQHRLSVIVLVIGIVATAVLTVSSRISYEHNESHLTQLQTKLTASALGIAQVNLELLLGNAVDLASEAASPSTVFTQAITPSLAPKGNFVNAALRLVSNGTVRDLAQLGAEPITNPNGKFAMALYKRSAAHDGVLVVTRVVRHHQQRLGYLLSKSGANGTYVASASQELPANRRVKIPAGSPDSDLNVALYFGKTTKSEALIETNVTHLPLSGQTATATVPFGTSVITLVAAARTSLAGAWSAFIPWGILIVGLLFSFAIGFMTDRLVRRRHRAESLAEQNSALYREQRSLSETLQRGLLPRQLPMIPGVDFATMYVPGSQGLEVGGDWYSAIRVDDDRFVFVVGDVSGHGVRAATVMASLRYTTRAFASIGYDPTTVLAMANREVEIGVDGHFATVLVGLVDNRKREMVLASAGHLDPLLIVDNKAHYLEVPKGLPLGVGTGSYPSITVPIPPGASLIGFTDGLVERRDAAIDIGLRRLERAASTPGDSIDSLVKHLADELSYPDAEDDIAIIGIHWHD